MSMFACSVSRIFLQQRFLCEWQARLTSPGRLHFCNAWLSMLPGFGLVEHCKLDPRATLCCNLCLLFNSKFWKVQKGVSLASVHLQQASRQPAWQSSGKIASCQASTAVEDTLYGC